MDETDMTQGDLLDSLDALGENIDATIEAIREDTIARCIAAAWDYMKRTPSGMAHAEGLQSAIRAAFSERSEAAK